MFEPSGEKRWDLISSSCAARMLETDKCTCAYGPAAAGAMTWQALKQIVYVLPQSTARPLQRKCGSQQHHHQQQPCVSAARARACDMGTPSTMKMYPNGVGGTCVCGDAAKAHPFTFKATPSAIQAGMGQPCAPRHGHTWTHTCTHAQHIPPHIHTP